MKQTGNDGGFFTCFLLNLILNSFWLIPVAIYAIAATVFSWPAWIGWTALGVWAVLVFLVTLFMSWSIRTTTASYSPTGLVGKTTVRRSSERANSLQEYANAHKRSAACN